MAQQPYSTYYKASAQIFGSLVVQSTVENGSRVRRTTYPGLVGVDLQAAERDPRRWSWVHSSNEAGVSFDLNMQERPGWLGIYSPATDLVVPISPDSPIPPQAIDTYTWGPSSGTVRMSLWEADQERHLALLTVARIPDLWGIIQKLNLLNVPYQFGRGFVRSDLQTGVLTELGILDGVGVFVEFHDYDHACRPYHDELQQNWS